MWLHLKEIETLIIYIEYSWEKLFFFFLFFFFFFIFHEELILVSNIGVFIISFKIRWFHAYPFMALFLILQTFRLEVSHFGILTTDLLSIITSWKHRQNKAKFPRNLVWPKYKTYLKCSFSKDQNNDESKVV